MKIKAVVKEPHKAPYVREIENELEPFREIVGGYIQVVPVPGVPGAVLVCNEEGKLNGLEPNLFMNQDIIVGTVIAAGVKGEDFVSLTPRQISDVELSLMVRAMHTPEKIRWEI